MYQVLHHTRVGRHVGEEHQRQTSGKESRAAAHLQALVAEDVPSEADTRRNLHVAVGPSTGVDVATAEVEVIDGVVAHQVVAVEGDHVKADTARQFQVLQDVPFVLGIKAVLVEHHFSVRVGLAAVAVSQTYSLGSRTVQEVVQRTVAVITRTATHVGVVGQLVLVAEARGDLVLAGIVGKVVGHGEHLVLHAVVVREQLVAQAHVGRQALGHRPVGRRLVAAHDVDEGERRGVGAARVVDVRVGEQQLVGNLVAEAAVQVGRNGAHLVVHGVHRVGESHGVLRQAVHTAQAIARVAGVTVHGVPSRVLRIVVAHGQAMVVVDVPVDAAQQLQVALVGGEVREGARVVAVALHHEVAHALHVGHGGAGDVVVRIGHTVLRRAPAVDDRRDLDILGVGEEEELVLHNRSAQGETVGRVAVRAALAQVGVVHAVTVHVLVVVVDVGRSLERVRTGLGHGVDTAADEVGLAYVKRGHHHLHLVDGVHRDGRAAAGQAGRESEVIVQVGAVQREVGGASVTSGKAHAVGVGREAHDVRNAAAHGRQGRQLCVRDIGRRTGLFGCKLGTGTRYDHLAQLGDVLRHSDVEVVGLTQLEGDVLDDTVGKSDIGNFHFIGSAHAHTLDGPPAVHVGHGVVRCSRRLVNNPHQGTDDVLTLLVGHVSGHGRRGHLSIHCRRHYQQEGSEKE